MTNLKPEIERLRIEKDQLKEHFEAKQELGTLKKDIRQYKYSGFFGVLNKIYNYLKKVNEKWK